MYGCALRREEGKCVGEGGGAKGGDGKGSNLHVFFGRVDLRLPTAISSRLVVASRGEGGECDEKVRHLLLLKRFLCAVSLASASTRNVCTAKAIGLVPRLCSIPASLLLRRTMARSSHALSASQHTPSIRSKGNKRGK